MLSLLYVSLKIALTLDNLYVGTWEWKFNKLFLKHSKSK